MFDSSIFLIFALLFGSSFNLRKPNQGLIAAKESLIEAEKLMTIHAEHL